MASIEDEKQYRDQFTMYSQNVPGAKRLASMPAPKAAPPLAASAPRQQINIPAGKAGWEADLVRMQNPDADVRTADQGSAWKSAKSALMYNSDIAAQQAKTQAAQRLANAPQASYSNEGRNYPTATPNPNASPLAQMDPTSPSRKDPANPLAANEIQPGIFRQGNSFSDTAEGAAAGARQAPISAQNMAAADALAQRYTNPLVQAAQAPQGPQNLTPRTSGSGYGLLDQGARDRRSAMMDAQQYKPGAKIALASLLNQQAAEPGQELERDKMAQRTQESAADRMVRGTEFQSKLGEAAADRALRSQELMDNSLTNKVKRDAAGVELTSAQRLQALQGDYLNAETDAKRDAAAKKIQALSGGAKGDEYMAVSSGQTVDPITGLAVKAPDLIINRRTGMPVSGQQAKPATALPSGMTRQVGTSGGKPVYEDASGKRFVGG